jgi:hypothetical protein
MTHHGPSTTYPPSAPPPWPQEVVSSDGATSHGGFRTRRPRVLIAVVGLAAVASGGIGLLLSQDDRPAGGSHTHVYEAEPVPERNGEVDAGGLGAWLPGAAGDVEVTAPGASCLGGDPAACETLLHLLAEECFAGSLDSCDALYEISAPESDHEDYGATCGGRFEDWTFAGVCSIV